MGAADLDCVGVLAASPSVEAFSISARDSRQAADRRAWIPSGTVGSAAGRVPSAVAIGPRAEPEVVWSPRALDREPGFLAYSITKTFTAALMLLLQEEGRLRLSDPVARWLPHVPESERMSLRQLLDHSAGVPDYGGLRAYHEAVRSSPTQPWSFGRFAAAPSALLSVDGRRVDARGNYHPGWVSHGVLASTPSELVRFLGALSHGGLLSRESLHEMTCFARVPQEFVPAPKGLPRWREPGYGLGLMVDLASPWGVVWGHNGGGPGYHSSAFHAPDLRGCGVTLCAMGAIEEDFVAEGLAFAALDLARES